MKNGIKHALLGECTHSNTAPILKEIISLMMRIRKTLIRKGEPTSSPQLKTLKKATDALAKWAYRAKPVADEEWTEIARIWAGLLPTCTKEREEREQKNVAKAVTANIIGIQLALNRHLKEWHDTTDKAQRVTARWNPIARDLMLAHDGDRGIT